MEKNLNFILTVLLIASTIFLSSAVALYFMRQAEIEKRVVLEKKLEEINKEKTKLGKDLEEAMAIKNDLEVKLSAIQEKAKSLEGQLGEERSSREAIYSQLENEKRESKKLVDNIMELKEEKEQVSLNLANIKSECELLKMQLYSVQQAKEVLENKLKEVLAKSEVELEKIVVKPEATSATSQEATTGATSAEVTGTSTVNIAPSLASTEQKGEVLVVNKKFDFVVINLGENAGMEPGMNLKVYRNGKFLTMLQVEKVHTSMSAAKIPPEAKNIDIKEGDEVVVQ